MLIAYVLPYSVADFFGRRQSRVSNLNDYRLSEWFDE